MAFDTDDNKELFIRDQDCYMMQRMMSSHNYLGGITITS